jgi:hypothetical protein
VAHQWEKMCDNRVKIELFDTVVRKVFQVDNRSLLVIREVLFLVGFYIVSLLKRK